MKYQFMPMFWGDFFANTLHLTAQEIGAYVCLIAHAWEHDGRVPYDCIRRIARVRHDHWPKVWKRLEPFFEWERCPHTGTPTWGTHARVLTELRHAAEISNKRKAAAEQKHSKSSANALQTPPHTTLQLPIESLPNGKGREAPNLQVHVNYRDPGVSYRSPPRAKSDNPLAPLPEKLLK